MNIKNCLSKLVLTASTIACLAGCAKKDTIRIEDVTGDSRNDLIYCHGGKTEYLIQTPEGFFTPAKWTPDHYGFKADDGWTYVIDGTRYHASENGIVGEDVRVDRKKPIAF